MSGLVQVSIMGFGSMMKITTGDGAEIMGTTRLIAIIIIMITLFTILHVTEVSTAMRGEREAVVMKVASLEAIVEVMVVEGMAEVDIGR